MNHSIYTVEPLPQHRPPSFRHDDEGSSKRRRTTTTTSSIPQSLLPPQPSQRKRAPTVAPESQNEIMLVQPIPGSYDQLLDSLLNSDFDPTSTAPPKTLPLELCKRVLSFLTIQRVQQKLVCATGASSHDYIHNLSYSLVDSESSWWLSKAGSMPKGRGSQWVQYTMNRKKNNLQRLSAVSIRIPPMPTGPLSVKEFCIQTFSFERGWHAVTPTFVAGNKVGWQRFAFPEVDVEEIRLVCLSNQMAEFFPNLEKLATEANANSDSDESRMLRAQLRRFESVGFFCAKFE